MLHALVLSDRPVEHDALAGVRRGACECGAAQAHGLGGDQDALGVQPVEQDLEAAAFLADAVLGGHRQRLDEQHVRVDGLAAHLRDLADLDACAIESRVEQREPVGRPAAGIPRRGPREDQHAVRDLRRGDPDLAAVDHVAVALAAREGAQPRRVEACVGFGDGEAGLLVAADQRRQPARLLVRRAEDDDRVQSEDVHVHGRRAREPGAGLGDRLHHDRGLDDAEPGATAGFRHRDAEPAGARDGRVEVVGKAARAIAFEPVRGVERCAEIADRVADGALLGAEAEVHRGSVPVHAAAAGADAHQPVGPVRVTPLPTIAAISSSE